MDYFGDNDNDFSNLLLKLKHEDIVFTNNYERYKNNSKFISDIMKFYFTTIGNANFTHKSLNHFLNELHFPNIQNLDKNIFNLIKNNPNNFYLLIILN